MSSVNKINVYISSKKRLSNEKSNDFTVDFPSGMIKCDPKKEFLVMNINGIIMQNSFYNTQEINNKYKVIVDDVITYNFEIPIGNYNVLELLDIFNDQLSSLVKVEYSQTLNKYKWTNNILINKNITIVSISANDFLGFKNNKPYDITTGNFVMSENTINVSGDELVLFQMPTIKQSYPCIDNFFNGSIVDSSIVAYLPINVPSFGLMIYDNQDGGDSFCYRIENEKIDSLRIVCFNQDMDNIEVGDYQFSVQFEIHQKRTLNIILENILKLVSNIFQWLGKDEKY